MTKSHWAAWGDVNAFFGLMLDNLTVLVLLLGLLTLPGGFTPEFVLGLMVPGTALGVLFGDLVYTWLAVRLARGSGRADVTAMPLGLDTPSTFAVAPLVLIPALQQGQKDGLSHEHAMLFAWHVGAAVLLTVGIFKTVVAPMGNLIRRWVPSAALLGSLAAVALALIAMEPLLDVTAVPLAGFPALLVILVALVAHRALPGRFPGALAAVLVGLAVYYGCAGLGQVLGWPLVPPAEASWNASASLPPWPAAAWQWSSRKCRSWCRSPSPRSLVASTVPRAPPRPAMNTTPALSCSPRASLPSSPVWPAA
jgi:AGZA family xanthine/uracil permease-like MFS transporter